ncbi:hypothetical protein [Streptomyces heilongjiangensis]|uniref:Uncharacterized protein n=1 Tax=Streptomyces heilongjiangensis TaxID=945052 RepID=A0ABW1BIJ2_9ACTN|nr:hypothetical protein [Streptomyces heilongjiangensis]MDC2951080.1 hypothetical protein [Streptomyces heilongjiangensis]
MELLHESTTRAEEPGGHTPTPEEWALHMDNIAARAMTEADADVNAFNNTDDCTPPKDLSTSKSLATSAEGTDSAMTTAAMPSSPVNHNWWGMISAFAGFAIGAVAICLFVAGDTSIGAVTATTAVLVGIFAALGKTKAKWLLGHGNGNSRHSAEEGLVTRSH